MPNSITSQASLVHKAKCSTCGMGFDPGIWSLPLYDIDKTVIPVHTFFELQSFWLLFVNQNISFKITNCRLHKSISRNSSFMVTVMSALLPHSSGEVSRQLVRQRRPFGMISSNIWKQNKNDHNHTTFTSPIYQFIISTAPDDSKHSLCATFSNPLLWIAFTFRNKCRWHIFLTPYLWWFDIGVDNSFVTPANRLLPEPMLTKSHVAM